MPDCRHLLCDQRADFQVTVRTGNLSKTAAFCTRHLTRAQDDVSRYDDVAIIDIQPIKESTVTNENPGPYPGPPSDAYRRGMENTITAREEVISNQTKTIAGLKESISSRDQQITNLEHDVSVREVTLRNRDARVNSLLTTQDALVSSLHVLADNAEDDGRQDLAEEVDALLAEYDLKPRRQEYTIEVLVPTKLHLHVTARSMNHARALYEAGDVDWNVADGEVQEDDIKVLDISEGSL